jgi:hypothetical protein
MLRISEFQSYRDGGTISMHCMMAVSWMEVPYLEMRRNKEIEICLDFRLGKEPKFWFGYPGKEDSEVIEEQSIIDYIVKKVEEYKKYQNHKLNSFINYRENLRDWKIKNILE